MNAPETPPVDRLIQQLPRHLKLSALRVFVTVLEHRSFRKAAAVMHLSQPAVTKTISTLGARLFHRVPGGSEPTVHGRSFAPRAARRGSVQRAAPCRLPFELPLPSCTVAAVSLRSHTLSPLADQLID